MAPSSLFFLRTGGGGSGIVTLLSSSSSSGPGEEGSPSPDEEANLALWSALGPKGQMNELQRMHADYIVLKEKMEMDLAERDKEVEELSSSDSVLVRREIVEQNKKLQLDVHNLVSVTFFFSLLSFFC
jgi:hypothetical protein